MDRSVLIERERQLVELCQALARTAEGQGALVCVGGPAGIGKSALLDALSARRRARRPRGA